VDVELQLTVENLLARYVHALDDDRLEDWPGFFSEKGRYLDRIRLNAKAPCFEEKIVVIDSRSVDTLLAIPL